MGIQSLALCLFSFNRFEPVWKGEKPNRTEPKLISLNQFLVRLGSKTKKKKTVWLFILVQNWTEPKILSSNSDNRGVGASDVND